MRQGRIEVGMTTEPTASYLLSTGEAKVLVDFRTPEATQKNLGGLYPFSCLYMESSWVRNHRATVQKLANALVASLRYISLHSAAEITAQLKESDYGTSKALYVQSLAMSKPIFTPDGVMPPSGPTTVLKVLMAANPQVRRSSIDLGKTYTTEFVNAVR